MTDAPNVHDHAVDEPIDGDLDEMRQPDPDHEPEPLSAEVVYGDELPVADLPELADEANFAEEA